MSRLTVGGSEAAQVPPCPVVTGRPQRFLVFTQWVSFAGLSLFFFGILYFNLYEYDIGPVGVIIICVPLLFLFFFLFIGSTILLFSWVPIVKVYQDSVRFSVIGISIDRSEVLKAVARRSELSEDWRVDIELAKPKSGRLLICLLYPVAFAFKNKVFISPMFLASPRREVKESIVAALCPGANRPGSQGPWD